VLLAPVSKNWALIFASFDVSGDLLNVLNTESTKFPNRPLRLGLVSNSAAHEFFLHRALLRIRKNGNFRGDTAEEEVRRFECTGAMRIDGHNNYIGTINRIINNQCPTSPRQELMSDRGDATNRDRNQYQQTQNCTISPATSNAEI
jgi:hypothetical protein